MAIKYSEKDKTLSLVFPISDEDLRVISFMNNYQGLGKSSRAFIADIIDAHYKRCEREGTLREVSFN